MNAECSTGNIPPGYKQTEVGVIPEDWGPVTIGDIAIKVGSGITPRGGNSNYKEYGRPFVRSQNVGWGILLLTDLVYIDNDTHKSFSSTELRQGDVLLNITGASIGRSAIADACLAGGNVNQHVCIIRTDATEIDTRFLNFILLSAQGQRQIDSFQAGGNREGLNFGQIRSIRLSLPPTKAEQESIVEALSDTDALIESLEQLIAKKHQIKQGVMQELLTGKRRLPGFEVKQGYKQTEVGVIPEDWEVKPLHALADKIMVGIASAATHAYRDRGIVMFRNQNIKPNYLDDSDVLYLAEDYEANFRNKRLRSGDLLTARTGYPGTTSIVPNNYEGSQSFTTLITRPRLDIVDSTYLCYFINSEAGQAYFEQNQIGGGQKNVNAGSLKYLPVTLPPIKVEQTAIASILSDMDSEITVLEEKLAKARQIKQGMMQELLTGRIRLI